MAHRDALWAVLGYSIFLTVQTCLGYPFQVLCRIVIQLTHFSEICILGFFFFPPGKFQTTSYQDNVTKERSSAWPCRAS